ncbi:YdcH family protein [Dechloromonas denitrificans]|uniref:YdcH family protein n=1 Tax=Dechloromonas denitrificans TaxID=281362 RepID=UPI001CF882D9|nr:YdcH family protein [Dechloromonas denitrificans]UCV10668.1 YdcH family protein [Dechloromonas denitrificans]
MSLQPPNEEAANLLRVQLSQRQIEHRDLDLAITHLSENPPPDDLLIRRLKKRKLGLKDKIMQLEQLLTPDIPA